MIKLDEVTKYFGPSKAIDNISLQVKSGEILGIVGPDGAGKTTLIRLMLGLLKPSNGIIKILGTTDIESVKSQLGYVAQKFSLYLDLTVIENLKLIGALYGTNNKTILTRAQTILEFTGLWQFKNRLSQHLSGGMKQKLALAAGLIHNPKVIFLDEPTTGVDPIARREFWQLLYKLNQQGMSIIIATPYMDEAELCHKIAFMHHGKIITCESPEQLINSYPYEILELNTEDYRIFKELSDSSIIDINSFGNKYHIVTNDILKSQPFINNYLHMNQLTSTLLKPIKPSLEDVFVYLASKAGDH